MLIKVQKSRHFRLRLPCTLLKRHQGRIRPVSQCVKRSGRQHISNLTIQVQHLASYGSSNAMRFCCAMAKKQRLAAAEGMCFQCEFVSKKCDTTFATDVWYPLVN